MADDVEFPMGKEIRSLIEQAARAWHASTLRPEPKKCVLAHWRTMIAQWVDRPEMPLLIRRPAEGRGREIKHQKTGRVLVPVDNTPAHWALAMALDGKTPSCEQALAALRDGSLGVAMALKESEKEQACYHGLLRKWEVLKPWRLCHVDNVADHTKGEIANWDIDALKRHTTRLLDPNNMFLIAKGCGFGEDRTFIRAFTGV